MLRIIHKNFDKIILRNLRSIISHSNRRLSFLSGSNASYIDDLYEEWLKNNKSVHKSWHLLFQAGEKGLNIADYYRALPVSFTPFRTISPSPLIPNQNVTVDNNEYLNEYLGVNNLIRCYQEKGHHIANIDPLGVNYEPFRKNPIELTLSYWGLNESHLNKIYQLPKTTYIGGTKTELSLKEIITNLSNVYISSIGVEYSHIVDLNQIEWIKKKLEYPGLNVLSREDKLRILNRIIRSTNFEMYLAKKYPSEKRFGLEGCDVMISSLKDIIDDSTKMGVESFIVGMAHRGRLNVLANVCRQPLEHIFCRFNDELQMEDQGSSDVKYHLGLSRKHINSKTGKTINISIVANPSHLEAVDPIVKGKCRAEQYLKRDKEGNKVLCILIHGDASFSGQGIVYETINLSDLINYSVHGTVHMIINNQIGFTTDPIYSRSTQYCTEIAKIVGAPIFHVNADDPDAVTQVSRIASEYRNVFKKDVVIDLIGYRRNGHNEGDNPAFTQPRMYKSIATKPNVLDIYSKKLMEAGVIDSEYLKNCVDEYENILEKNFITAQSSKCVNNKVWIDSPWKDFFKDKLPNKKQTGVSLNEVRKHLKFCCEVPTDFSLHPAIKRVMAQRMDVLGKDRFDWAMAEIAAFSTLLVSGVHIRLSGQDVERGTFSHRHHTLHDNNSDTVYTALNNLSSEQEKYVVCNSPLSEYGVLGFEHGYSLTSPNTLVIWEGQFGDFANTAQCVIDQFISSGEDKWIRQSGLVMILPHGYDGMGPEHSSARIERFLQLTKEDPDIYPNYCTESFEVDHLNKCNYIVAYPTTPANLFHLLRRQLALNFRKPLIIFSAKNLLRHEMARSNLAEIKEGTSFKRMIEESGLACSNKNTVKRLIFCSGKIYYELFKARTDKNLQSQLAIARIEQISPFPFDLISEEINKYPNADIMYVQEEPKNQGTYNHVKQMISLCCHHSKPLKYCGRVVSSSPASGLKHQHNLEQSALLNNAFKF